MKLRHLFTINIFFCEIVSWHFMITLIELLKEFRCRRQVTERFREEGQGASTVEAGTGTIGTGVLGRFVKEDCAHHGDNLPIVERRVCA